MRAALLKEIGKPLQIEEIAKPTPQSGELLVKVKACGVCRTDLHILDGELPPKQLPLILGHEIVGTVEEMGASVKNFQKGDLVGIPWLAKTCGLCEFCKKGKENLCEKALFTGYDRMGGYAEYTCCFADYALKLPPLLAHEKMAPLLCAGLIGYRTYRIAAAENTIGFYGFGVAAKLLMPTALFEKKQVFAFTRENDREGQDLARKMGAVWAGSSQEMPPQLLDAALIFAPVGELIPIALKALKRGGRCVSGGIHMSDIPSFPYKDLWEERSIHSVANLTREDGKLFFSLFEKNPFEPSIQSYPLEKINEAIDDFRKGKNPGASVIVL